MFMETGLLICWAKGEAHGGPMTDYNKTLKMDED